MVELKMTNDACDAGVENANDGSLNMVENAKAKVKLNHNSVEIFHDFRHVTIFKNNSVLLLTWVL